MTLADLLVLLHPSGAAAPGRDVVLVHRELSAAAVAEDGVVYVLAPPLRRIALLGRLRREGLRPAAWFLHVRGAEDLVVQLDRRALVYAGEALVSLPAWARLAAARAPRPAVRLAAAFLPRVGVACRRDDGRPLAAWLGEGRPDLPGGLILRSTLTDGRARRFVYSLSGPRVLVKLDGDDDERARLERFGPAAAAAGVLVPEPRRVVGGPPGAVAATLLPGRPAASAIAAGSVAPAVVLESLAAWLERWNSATAAPSTVDERLLEEEVLAPAALLEPVLADGASYRGWLERRCTTWLGAPLPLVDAHLDLTLANVLLAGGGRLSIVDWAEARSGCLPLVDLLYAAADAAAAADPAGDRASAFLGGAYDRLVAVHERRLARALGVSDPARELCFHACWLHHARNELQRGSAPAPFRRIVEAAAARALRAG